MIVFETLETQGRSLEWLARQLGVHRTLLSHYKAGRRPMPTGRGSAGSNPAGHPAISGVLQWCVDLSLDEQASA